MLLAHNVCFQDAAGGIQRIHGGVDTLFHDLTGQNGSGIQVGKGGGRGGVGQVVGRHINGLNRGDGPITGGSDTLLQGTQLVGQRGLVTNGGGHTAHQGGNFGAGLHKTEDVVNKQQHVLVAFLAEVFCHGKTGKCNSHTCSWWLVHLSEHHGCLINNA